MQNVVQKKGTQKISLSLSPLTNSLHYQFSKRGGGGERGGKTRLFFQHTMSRHTTPRLPHANTPGAQSLVSSEALPSLPLAPADVPSIHTIHTNHTSTGDNHHPHHDIALDLPDHPFDSYESVFPEGPQVDTLHNDIHEDTVLARSSTFKDTVADGAQSFKDTAAQSFFEDQTPASAQPTPQGESLPLPEGQINEECQADVKATTTATTTPLHEQPHPPSPPPNSPLSPLSSKKRFQMEFASPQTTCGVTPRLERREATPRDTVFMSDEERAAAARVRGYAAQRKTEVEGLFRGGGDVGAYHARHLHRESALFVSGAESLVRSSIEGEAEDAYQNLCHARTRPPVMSPRRRRVGDVRNGEMGAALQAVGCFPSRSALRGGGGGGGGGGVSARTPHHSVRIVDACNTLYYPGSQRGGATPAAVDVWLQQR